VVGEAEKPAKRSRIPTSERHSRTAGDGVVTLVLALARFLICNVLICNVPAGAWIAVLPASAKS
jgi:hypothetical protein